MAFLPELPVWDKTVLNTQQFLGLNRGLSIGDGEMADMLNMSCDNFPVLSTRQKRGMPTFRHNAAITPDLAGQVDGMLGTDRLVVCHEGKVYLDGEEVPIELSTDPSKREKKLVSMGAYVCIWPDKKYFNVNNLDDCGDMGSKWTAAEGDTITAMMCRKDGTDYDMDTITVSDTPPTDPDDGQFWLDMSGEVDVLKQYSKLHGQWMQVATTYIKLQSPGIGKDLKQYDSVWLSGAVIDAQNTETVEPGSATVDAKDVQMSTTHKVKHDDDSNNEIIVQQPTPDSRTITVLMEGIPYGAYVDSAEVSMNVSFDAPWDSRNVLTVNGSSFEPGNQTVPIEVKGNGEISLKFDFKPRYVETYGAAGTFVNILKITNIKVTAHYLPANLSDDEADLDQVERLNTTNIVYGCGDDYIIVAGLLHRHLTLKNTLAVEMKIPDLDYICESSNRIWGCVYQEKDGTVVNELRCCALGDFRNWSKFQGTAADSYTVTLGSDGVFTGAISHQGVPIFFKESYIHRVSGTVPANYTIITVQGRGVQEGSWKSLAVVNETLFYKSRNDVMAYEGAMPYAVSSKLGQKLHTNAVAGGYRDKYYICMQDEDLTRHTYVLDVTKGLWHQEGTEKITHMATAGGELVLAIQEESDAATRAAEATHLRTVSSKGTVEEDFDWSVTFGILGFQSEQQKYLSRYNIRAQVVGPLKVEMQYDSDGKWIHMGTMKSPRLRTFLLPIIPRRCDHCQLRISGKGTINIYSVAREYENGGDG